MGFYRPLFAPSLTTTRKLIEQPNNFSNQHHVRNARAQGCSMALWLMVGACMFGAGLTDQCVAGGASGRAPSICKAHSFFLFYASQAPFLV